MVCVVMFLFVLSLSLSQGLDWEGYLILDVFVQFSLVFLFVFLCLSCFSLLLTASLLFHACPVFLCLCCFSTCFHCFFVNPLSFLAFAGFCGFVLLLVVFL